MKVLNQHVSWNQTCVYIHRDYENCCERFSHYKFLTAQCIGKHCCTEYAEYCLKNCTGYRNNSCMENSICSKKILVVCPCKFSWPEFDSTSKRIKTIIKGNSNSIPERIYSNNYYKNKNKINNYIKNKVTYSCTPFC